MVKSEQVENESAEYDKSEVESSEDTHETSDDEILRIARERFNLAEEDESEIRKEALDDLEFRAGNQWPEEIKKLRTSENRPCLTVNRIPQFIRQITNDQRQNRPSLKISPVDDNADIDTAKVLQGMIRHIEYNSNADVAYDTGFEGAVTKSFGFWRVITDYMDPMSFDQEILIKRIRNAFSVYMDPSSKEPDGSDTNWAFIFEDIPKEDFKAEYPDSKISTTAEWNGSGDQAEGWLSESTVRVAEYFYKEFKSFELVLLSNGLTFKKSELPNKLPDGIKIVKTRKSVETTIKWCKINGREILSKTDWPGKWIPIVPVIGDEIDINGKRILEGVVRHAKDPQRMYNYWASTETETITLAPKAPFIVAEGQITPEYQAQWKQANVKNYAFLPYKPTTHNGQLAPPPQRMVFEPAVQAITQARGLAADDMKATTGIYDAGLGNRSNEQSGVAIQRRNMQSQTSNFHFVDNLSRSLRHTGRIIVDLIPKIYDTQRAVRILGESGEEEIVVINQVIDNGGSEAIKNNISAGKYDVTVATGPSFASKRQEAVASMIDLSKVAPQVAQVAADLMIQNMDWPGAQEIAARVKKTLPPGIADDPKDKKQQVPPQIQSQLAQQGQLIQQMTDELNKTKEIINTKTIEIASRERIELAKLEVGMRTELLKLSSKEAMIGFERELSQIDQRQQMLEQNPEMVGQGFETEEPIENQNLNGAGPEGAVIPNEQQQPTGGFPPG